MKNNIILICSVLISFASVGQKPTYQRFTYAQTQNMDEYINVKNKSNVLEYETADGIIVKVGDTIYMGVPTSSEAYTRGRTGTYGSNFKYSSTAARTENSAKFETLIYGKPASFGNVMLAMNGEPTMKPGTEMMGEVVIVREMELYHKGSKKKPLAVMVLLGEPHDRAFGINKYISTDDLEKSLAMGELVPSNLPMSREEAIAKLKEAKDLLDLDMMTQEEYDGLKEKLAPIIRGE